MHEKNFGPRMKQRRFELKLTHAELAKQVGSTKAALWQIEAGELEPRIALQKKIADALQVTLLWMWGFEADAKFVETDKGAMANISEFIFAAVEDPQAFMDAHKEIRRIMSRE